MRKVTCAIPAEGRNLAIGYDRTWVESSHLTVHIPTTGAGPIVECPHLICNTHKAGAVVRVSGTSVSTPIAALIGSAQIADCIEHSAP